MMMNDEPNKVFDVSKPSRTSPDNTSRPIIVGHRPSMPDPMMRSEEPSTKPPTEPIPPPPPPPAPGVVLQTAHAITQPPRDSGHNSPMPEHHQTKVIEVSDEARSEIAAGEPKLPITPQPEILQPASGGPTPHEPPPGIVSTSPPIVDTPGAVFVSSTTSPGGNVVVPTPTPAPIPTPAASVSVPSSMPAVPEVHHQTLPMGHAPATSAGRLKHIALWLFVILFLAGFAAYLAVDAGFVNTSVKLPFHIFNRQQ